MSSGDARASGLRLGFAGTPEFAVPALDALMGHGWIVPVVLTQPDRRAGRGQALAAGAVKRRALELGLEVRQPDSGRNADLPALLHALALDALVVVAYGQILPPAVLAVPRLGCLNIHASLLPRWRGAAPIQRALLAGDSRTGVSIMRMDEGLDTGPVLAVSGLDIEAGETAAGGHQRRAGLGARLLCDTRARLAAGEAAATPQASTGITYAAKVDKTEALIDWREDAAAIDRRVRAFNPWPIAETRLGGQQLRIWEARVAPIDPPPQAGPPGSVLAAADVGIDVACGTGVLRLTRLQLAGRKPLDAREFLAGRRLDGARLGPP